jgi:hypothetical protein
MREEQKGDEDWIKERGGREKRKMRRHKRNNGGIKER